MRSRYLASFACGLLAATLFSSWTLSRAAGQSGGDFTVHEWGTFTSITGSEGKAITWRPLDATDDLPGFVEHFQDNPRAKSALAGTVRMETPVMYFYAPRKMNVSVNVHFPNGLLTDWYPHARRGDARGCDPVCERKHLVEFDHARSLARARLSA